MALTSTINKIIYEGDGVATSFPFAFPVLDQSHLSVIFTNTDGMETTLSSSQYGLSGPAPWPNGGAITYPVTGSPLAVGEKITIARTVPYIQNDRFSNSGGYYPEIIERRFDLVYMALQQFEERLSRAVLGSISDPTTEQSNYLLIQALQADLGSIDRLTARGDLLTRDASDYKRLARGIAGQFLGVSGSDIAWLSPASSVWETGDIRLSFRSTTSLSGWVKVNDGSIGETGSGATTRANDDTLDLYVEMYTTFDNTLCPVSGGRSGSNAAAAQADFAAGKTLTLTKMLGRALVVAGLGAGLTNRVLGSNFGNEEHEHTGVTGNDNGGAFNAAGSGINVSNSPHGHPFTTDPESSMQPSVGITVFLKL